MCEEAIFSPFSCSRHAKCCTPVLSPPLVLRHGCVALRLGAPGRLAPAQGPASRSDRPEGSASMTGLAMQTDVKIVGTGDVDTAELPTVPPLRALYFGLTDSGKVRANNED